MGNGAPLGKKIYDYNTKEFHFSFENKTENIPNAANMLKSNSSPLHFCKKKTEWRRYGRQVKVSSKDRNLTANNEAVKKEGCWLVRRSFTAGRGPGDELVLRFVGIEVLGGQPVGNLWEIFGNQWECGPQERGQAAHSWLGSPPAWRW